MPETKPKPNDSAVSSASIVRAATLGDTQTSETIKLTRLRRMVFDALTRAERPLGAYDLLTEIEAATGKRLMPTSVYRALEFLRDHDMIARIESLNAFLVLDNNSRRQADAYFICDDCGVARAIKDPSLGGLIEYQAAALGFQISKRIIEMKGLCHHCRKVHLTPPVSVVQY